MVTRGSALFYAIADAFVEFEAHAEIDAVFTFFPAATEVARRCRTAAVGCGDEAGGRAEATSS